LFEVKLKALTMEEKDAKLWWDEVQNIVQKDTRKVYRRYERNERLYMHRISEMEKVIPSFQYEPLLFILKPKTSNEEEERENTNGAGSLGTIIKEEEPIDLKGGKHNP
jgi:hypothetical protein